jgi:hypothetical protein
MKAAYRLAGCLLALALLVTGTIGWGCDKYRRTYVETYGTVGVALPPPPQYSQPAAQPAYAAPAAAQPTYTLPAQAAAPAQPQYQQAYEQPSAQPADQSDVEVLARGPVHEAFAEPVVANPAPGITVSVAPPAAVQEMPPDDRPAAAIWIPGYWAWDDDRSGFIWVSGIWRIAPPGCRWVPGYWAPVADGYQWVPGFWLSETTQQVQYLPTPPASLEAGPVGDAPSPDYIWTTGYWYRDSLQYAWRPGCWQLGRADWVWAPAHYVWTPRGCVFVAGYWDYGLGGRGLLFAPVRFGRPLYMQPGYFYSPTVVIETDNLSFAFFSRPGYCHYYFGDYFDAAYVGLGIVPWYECRTRCDWYDPIYVYAAWSHRHEDRWEAREREHYDLLRRDVAARPPRTFALQAGFHVAAVQGSAGPALRPVVMAAPLADVVARKVPGMRFEKVDAARRTQLQQYASSLGAYRDQRVAVEAGTGAGRPAGRPVAASHAAASSRVVPATAAASRAVTPPAGASATGPAVARPATVQKPDWTRPATPQREADRAAPMPGGTKTDPGGAPRLVSRPSVPQAEIRRPQPFVVAPEARRSQPAPQPQAPALRPQPQAQAVPVIPPEIKRPQSQAASPIPAEIKRPQPFVAAPEARRSQPAPQPQAPALRPQPAPQPQAPALRAQPQAQTPAPRFQPPAQPVQPQRVERPAPAAPVERAAPQRIEAPRPVPPVPQAGDGKEKSR